MITAGVCPPFGGSLILTSSGDRSVIFWAGLVALGVQTVAVTNMAAGCIVAAANMPNFLFTMGNTFAFCLVGEASAIVAFFATMGHTEMIGQTKEKERTRNTMGR
jgi:hypothetical protein